MHAWTAQATVTQKKLKCERMDEFLCKSYSSFLKFNVEKGRKKKLIQDTNTQQTKTN